MFGALNLAARRGFAPNVEVAAANLKSAGSTARASSATLRRSAEVEEPSSAPSAKKLAARQRGIRGETFGYWYLRRHGYIMIARNFTVAGIKGELDLVGYDGEVLAFVEVKLRTIDPRTTEADKRTLPRLLPEDAVGPAKRRDLIRMANHFLSYWRKHKGPFRFDILAIESQKGKAPVVRLHKDAFAMRI